jgi:hypothetical protein
MLEPQVDGLGRHALFFEIMKNVVYAMVCKPQTGFFDAVAVGNAVNGDSCFAHGDESCRKPSGSLQWATIEK